jgi:hypothetical protein
MLTSLCCRVALAATLCVPFLAAPASAGENVYATVGNWTVMSLIEGNEFIDCKADLSDQGNTLRLSTDGQLWQILIWTGKRKDEVEVYYGFGHAGEVANFHAIGDGWAYYTIERDQLNAFRQQQTFNITLGRKDIVWLLRGAGAAIDQARDCARNKGKVQTAAAPPPGGRVPGTGRDCPAPGSLRSKNSNRAVNVVFFNGGNVPVDIYWIDFEGGWKKYHTLRPNSNVSQPTYATHPWVAVFRDGRCHKEVFMPDPRGGAEANNFQVW